MAIASPDPHPHPPPQKCSSHFLSPATKVDRCNLPDKRTHAHVGSERSRTNKVDGFCWRIIATGSAKPAGERRLRCAIVIGRPTYMQQPRQVSSPRDNLQRLVTATLPPLWIARFANENNFFFLLIPLFIYNKNKIFQLRRSATSSIFATIVHRM